MRAFSALYKPWMHEARCVTTGADPDIFFNEERQDEAEAICSECPVRATCQEAGRKEVGWWGGPGGRDLDAKRHRKKTLDNARRAKEAAEAAAAAAPAPEPERVTVPWKPGMRGT